MKKLFLSATLLLCASFSRADTFTNRFGLVQISTSPGDIWGTKTNANWATVDAGVAGQSLYNVFTTTQVFSGDVVFPNISPGGYMTVDSSGNLTTQAGGGGGGASSLATALGTTAGFSTLISTPTGAVILNKNQFVGQLVGSATAYYDLNQNTTYYIHNGASVQTATMNISTATIGNVTVSTLTVLSSATIANVNLTGTTLAYSSGTFLNSVAIGTTNANGQTLRVLDGGTGINTYESVSNQTLYYELENNTSGTLANEYLQLVGTGGDSATGAAAGDAEVKALNNLYLVAGGAASSRGIQISSNGVTHIYYSDGSTGTTANAGGNFIQNTSSLQSGATFFVSSGTVNNLNSSKETVLTSFSVGNLLQTANGSTFLRYNQPASSPLLTNGGVVIWGNNYAGSYGSTLGFGYGLSPSTASVILLGAISNFNGAFYQNPTFGLFNNVGAWIGGFDQAESFSVGVSTGFEIGTSVGSNNFDVAGRAMIGADYTTTGANICGVSSNQPCGAIAPVNGLSIEGGLGVGTLADPGAGNIKTNYGVVAATVTLSSFLQLAPLTHATIQALTPGATNQVYACSDCSTVPVCISTGTAHGAWSLITNKSSACQ